MQITWLAAADARGHLMRASVMRTRLAADGVRVDVVTTSEEGRAFLAAMGTPSELLSSHYGVVFDDRQNMARARTEARVLKYLLSPNRARADRARLRRLAEGSALLVNDFHPLPLLAGGRSMPPIVHVYGENLFRAIEDHFEDRLPDPLSEGYRACVRGLRDRAFGCIEHSLVVPIAHGQRSGARSFRLPPIVALPERSALEVRAALGIQPGQRVAAVYLNPHFADPRIASAVEQGLAAGGFAVHAVGEGFASRRGWRAHDPHFVDVAAAADVLVSAPGMGAVGTARLCGTPLVALVTDQPEQRQNLRFLRGGRFEVIDLARDELDGVRLYDAVCRIASGEAPLREPARATIAAIHDRWARVLIELAAEASTLSPQQQRHPRRQHAPSTSHHRARARDQQPALQPRS